MLKSIKVMKSVQKKIILVFNSLDIGGIETKIVDICSYYSQNPSIKVFLLLKSRQGPLLYSIPKNIHIISSNITSFFKLKTILFPFWLSIIFKKINPKLIVSFGNYSSVCTIIGKLLSQSKSKIIISEDSSVDQQIKMDKFSFIRKILIKLTYPLAQKIIVLSSVGRKKLISIVPLAKNKIIVRKNWLPFKFTQNIFKNKSEKKIDILFLGRFEPQKNPLKFVEIIKHVIKELPNLKAVMVGNGSLKNEIIKSIIKNNLQKNIVIKPATTNNINYFKKSKIFLLTSVHEGFPLTILEASATGTIPVCNNLSELKNYFKYQPKLLLFQSPQNASKNILFLLKNIKTSSKISTYYQNLVFKNQQLFFYKTIKEFQNLL